MGERTPHCDPAIRAALVGLAANHGRGHVVRAVLEGVAFSLRDTFTIFSELGVPVDRIVVGGGARGRRCGGRFRRTCTARRSRRSPPMRARRSARRFSPVSVRACGAPSTKRSTRSSAAEPRRLRMPSPSPS
jgi:hypothetical protein